MQTIKEILETVAIVLSSIAGLLLALYAVLLFFDRWLKFKTGNREREGLSNLLVAAYKGQNPVSTPPDDGGHDPVPPQSEQEQKPLGDHEDG